ncbi:hypothetical protein BpHYR1_025256 [Brachionus plicatilis]|uniref:Uncharacterized protein n=1 Tax=Brachionus plicatilis TaxID=10195 RepID=A0A3M7SDE2_BRAPC|nr:hypothetical protein BpHYR1_025256 [Brachionus plicatilis]
MTATSTLSCLAICSRNVFTFTQYYLKLTKKSKIFELFMTYANMEYLNIIKKIKQILEKIPHIATYFVAPFLSMK